MKNWGITIYHILCKIFSYSKMNLGTIKEIGEHIDLLFFDSALKKELQFRSSFLDGKLFCQKC